MVRGNGDLRRGGRGIGPTQPCLKRPFRHPNTLKQDGGAMPAELKSNKMEPEQAEQNQLKADQASPTCNEDPRRSAVLVAVSVGAVIVLILGLFAFEELMFAPKKLSDVSGTDLKQPEVRGAALRVRYSEWTLDQTVRVFEWHARSTKVIFWISMLITV